VRCPWQKARRRDRHRSRKGKPPPLGSDSESRYRSRSDEYSTVEEEDDRESDEERASQGPRRGAVSPGLAKDMQGLEGMVLALSALSGPGLEDIFADLDGSDEDTLTRPGPGN